MAAAKAVTMTSVALAALRVVKSHPRWQCLACGDSRVCAHLAVSSVAPPCPAVRLARASRSGWCILETSGDAETPEVSDPKTTRPRDQMAAKSGRPPVRPPVCLLTRLRGRVSLSDYICHSGRATRFIIIVIIVIIILDVRSLAFEGTAALSHKHTASVSTRGLAVCINWRAAKVGGRSGWKFQEEGRKFLPNIQFFSKSVGK